jgi:CheY-like chemotaxis protein
MELAITIIDDSELDCFIAKKIVERSDRNLKVTTYTDASIALIQIEQYTASIAETLTIILLDLYLPVMSGFEFIEKFEKLPWNIRDKYMIYVLSSTLNKTDVNRVSGSKVVAKMLDKPLTKAGFDFILSDIRRLKLQP